MDKVIITDLKMRGTPLSKRAAMSIVAGHLHRVGPRVLRSHVTQGDADIGQLLHAGRVWRKWLEKVVYVPGYDRFLLRAVGEEPADVIDDSARTGCVGPGKLDVTSKRGTEILGLSSGSAALPFYGTCSCGKGK